MDGRLTAPVSYVNGQAAFFLVGLWPALAIAARRGSNAVVRAISLGFAVAMLAGWLSTQSKGGAVAFIVSAVVVFAAVPGRLRLLLPTLVTLALVAPWYDGLTAGFGAGGADAAGAACGRDRTRALPRQCGRRRRLRARRRADRRAGARSPGRGGGRRRRVGGRGRGRARRSRAARRPSARLRLRQVGELQAAPDLRVGQRPPAQPRLEPLRLLARQPGRVRRASARRDRRPRLRGAVTSSTRAATRPRSGPTPCRWTRSWRRASSASSCCSGFFVLTAVGVAIRRDTLAGAAALGTLATYFAVHASGDWVWALPGDRDPRPARRRDRARVGTRAGRCRPAPDWIAAGAAAGVALVLFAPPWLSGRITDRVSARETSRRRASSWARRLDPLALEPYLVEAGAGVDSGGRVAAARARGGQGAAECGASRYLLGLAYLDAGRKADARAELLEARRLYPGAKRSPARWRGPPEPSHHSAHDRQLRPAAAGSGT